MAFEQAESKRKEIEFKNREIEFKHKELEYEKVISDNENDIKSLISILQKNGIKLDKVIETSSRLEKRAIKTEEKLDQVQNTLNKAVESVVEKRNNKDDKNYLCVLKLKEPKRIKGKKYNYYAIRCTGKKTLTSRKHKLKYDKVICTIDSNYAISSWKVIKEQLRKERKISTYGNHFYVYDNKGISVISEEELGYIFEDVLSGNRNRIKR